MPVATSPPHTRFARAWPWLWAGLFYAVVTVAVTAPLAFVAGSALTRPFDDPILTTWILWWNTQALPLTATWWNAPFFFPTPETMAFSELLLGQLPITAPIQWLTHNPVLANNVAVLLSFPLCALAAHALAYELTRRHDAGLLGGLVFGFSAIRANEIGHVQMLSYYWLPVVLLALHCYLRTPRLRWLALFAAASLMQVLCNGYALFQLPILVGLWVLWFSTTTRIAVYVSAALICGLLPLLPILLEYQNVQSALHLQRSIDDVRRFSADVGSLVSAPAENVLLGRHLTSRQSYGLFPGLTLCACLGTAIVIGWRRRAPERLVLGTDRIVLVVIGITALLAFVSVLVVGPWRVGPLTMTRPHKPLTIAILAAVIYALRGPRWRQVWRTRSVTAFYALAAVAMYVLSFGPEPRVWGARMFYQAPYAWLMALPGFHAIRAPNRFAMVAVCCVAIVVALTYARWSSTLGRWRRPMLLILCAGLILDGWFKVSVQALPAPGPPDTWRDARAILELPLKPESDAPALYRSMAYARPLVNGVSGYTPPHYPALVHALGAADLNAIHELTPRGAIGIAIDRSSAQYPALATAVAGLEGAESLGQSASWSMFLARRTAQAPSAPGPSARITSLSASPNPQSASRMSDGRLDTTWSSGVQSGTEEMTIELHESQDLGAVVFRLGPCPFGFPRELTVETSADGSNWTVVSGGPTAIATLRAALADPRDVPVIIPLQPTHARWVRLRQVAREIRTPWCVAELSVHRPR